MGRLSVILVWLAVISSTHAFSSINLGTQRQAALNTELSLADSPTTSQQAQYGKDLELPSTYVRCGKCHTHFAITEAELGKGKGRRLECSVCKHSWFQSKDRLMDIKDGFELVERPSFELDRIELNLKENKAPNFQGDFKLYVGNIAFECNETDVFEKFSEAGSVGDVSLVRDDVGKNRGFGFVTMRTKEDGAKAMEILDGVELMGRTITVRESNN